MQHFNMYQLMYFNIEKELVVQQLLIFIIIPFYAMMFALKGPIQFKQLSIVKIVILLV